MVKYQLDNPNNCRIKIDFNNAKNPVKFEYVGKDSAFKVCYNFFRTKLFISSALVFALLVGIFWGYLLNTSSNKIKTMYIGNLALISLLVYLYLFPFILALLFSKIKVLLRLMPYIWSAAATKYFAKFTNKDIKDNKIEIPLYGNVFLSYRLRGDFINKIKILNIIEHPFNILTSKKRLFSKNERILKPNEYLWKAIFEFQSKPKNGSLRVLFS